jgi:hypothetical protein
MSVVGRLAGFAVVLALVFAGAALAGSRLDVHPGKTATEKPGMGAMDAPQPCRLPSRRPATPSHEIRH